MTSLAHPLTSRLHASANLDTNERGRRRFVQIVAIVYWLLIFEGVLRKWVFPGQGRLLFFIRDPFVILAYLLAFSYRMRPISSLFLVLAMMIAVFAVPIVLLQYSAERAQFSWLLAAYGYRNYFLYVPLAFFVARYFGRQDIMVLMRRTLLLSIPIAVLVYVQVLSPGTAPINQGLGKNPDEIYINGGVTEQVVRTYGTFTSSPGQGAFVTSSVAMVLSIWLLPAARRPLRGVALIAATGAVMSCAGLSGSRGALIACGLVVCAAMVAALMVAGRALAVRVIAVPILLVLLGIAVMPVIFPVALDALATRWKGAGESETGYYGRGGVLARALSDLTTFASLLPVTPPQGFQMGIGGNAGSNLGAQEERMPLSTDEEWGALESDWGRNIVELGPIPGMLFIAFRIALTFWMGRNALAATRRSGDPLPLVLFGYVGVLMASGQITGHGTLNGYAWLFAGFCMALSRESGSEHQYGSSRNRISFW